MIETPTNPRAGREPHPFGFSLALSADGTTLVVGAPGESSASTFIGGEQADNSAPGAGALYVFTQSGGTWSQQTYIKASNTGAHDSFGAALALSSDGARLFVGAPDEGSCAIGIDGDPQSNACPGSGAVYEYRHGANGWSFYAYIKASNTSLQVPRDAGAGTDNPRPAAFGSSVATDGVRLVVGAPYEDSGACCVDGDQHDHSYPNAGAVYVYDFEP